MIYQITHGEFLCYYLSSQFLKQRFFVKFSIMSSQLNALKYIGSRFLCGKSFLNQKSATSCLPLLYVPFRRARSSFVTIHSSISANNSPVNYGKESFIHLAVK